VLVHPERELVVHGLSVEPPRLANVCSISDRGTPWFTITKNPTFQRVPQHAGRRLERAGTPAKHGPKSMIGIAVSRPRALVSASRWHARLLMALVAGPGSTRADRTRPGVRASAASSSSMPSPGALGTVMYPSCTTKPGRAMSRPRASKFTKYSGDQEVRDRRGDLNRRGQTDRRAVVVVRRDRDERRLGHLRDRAQLEDAAAVAHVRVDDVRRAELEDAAELRA
jgi:hypothetical protein